MKFGIVLIYLASIVFIKTNIKFYISKYTAIYHFKEQIPPIYHNFYSIFQLSIPDPSNSHCSVFSQSGEKYREVLEKGFGGVVSAVCLQRDR